MSYRIYDAVRERWYMATDAMLADKLIAMSKTKPLWEVIAYIIVVWKKSAPAQWESFIIDVKDKVKSRKNIYGSTESKVLRYTLDIPHKIYSMIRILYPPEKLPMNKKFFREFARRFSEFKVAEKI